MIELSEALSIHKILIDSFGGADASAESFKPFLKNTLIKTMHK